MGRGLYLTSSPRPHTGLTLCFGYTAGPISHLSVLLWCFNFPDHHQGSLPLYPQHSSDDQKILFSPQTFYPSHLWKLGSLSWTPYPCVVSSRLLILSYVGSFRVKRYTQIHLHSPLLLLKISFLHPFVEFPIFSSTLAFIGSSFNSFSHPQLLKSFMEAVLLHL